MIVVCSSCADGTKNNGHAISGDCPVQFSLKQRQIAMQVLLVTLCNEGLENQPALGFTRT